MSSHRKKFFNVLKNIFIGERIEGKGGYVNLMKVKSLYYRSFEKQLNFNIEKALVFAGLSFREEMYRKLYTFFKRYFSESGSIFFAHTPVHEKIYEKIYSDDKDVMLFWKTKDLYYVKTERLYRDMELEIEHYQYKFYLTVKDIEHKQSNEKKEIVFEFDKIDDNGVIVCKVLHSKNGKKTKVSDIHKAIKKKYKNITTEVIERAFTTFKKQSEIDYFIHKNAAAFLKEQFNFWIKGYLMDDETVFDVERLAQLKALKEIAFLIINVVAQFEDELVKIWNKPKFVRNSNYVITLDRIANKNTALIDIILKHPNLKTQVAEWQALGMVEDTFKPDLITAKNNELFENAYLNLAYQYLPLDTKYFKDLELQILALFENLDEALDGWLIHSENYQALNTIKEKFRTKIRCIHIDPPYNTNTSGFLYNNGYKHSSWLTMMENRIHQSYSLLSDEGSFLCHIDENEYEHLQLLCNTFNVPNAGTIVWDKKNPMLGRKGIATQHEYLIWRSNKDSSVYIKNNAAVEIINKSIEIINKYEGVNEKSRKAFAQWVGSQENFTGGDKAYKLLEDDGRVFRSVAMGAPEKRTNPKYFIPLMHPITKKECPVPPNGWSRTPENLQKMIQNGDILFGKDEKNQPQKKVYLTLNSKKQISSIIQDAKKGKGDIDRLNLNFPYCHPVSLYNTLIGAVTLDKKGIVLDYFAGSGTTGHSVLNLNKTDDGNRKFILIELGEHFETTVIPRIKKVAFSQSWKDGKAIKADSIGGFFKYYQLEQYEEALRKVQYEDKPPLASHSLFHQYLFLKDRKLSKAISAEEDKIKTDLTKLYPDIDIAETLSNLRGKAIKQIKEDSVVFEDDTIVNTAELDYKLIKPLIWW